MYISDSDFMRVFNLVYYFSKEYCKFLLQHKNQLRKKAMLVVLLFCSLLASSAASNILVIAPSLSPSLLIAMGRVADTLAGTGRHFVTMWIPEMNLLQMNGSNLAHRIIHMKNISNAFQRLNEEMPELFDNAANSFWSRLLLDDAELEWCEAVLKRRSELDQLRTAQFDLVYFNMEDLCFFGISHYLNISQKALVITGPIPDQYNWFLGIPQPLSIVPSMQESVMVGPRMNILMRALNVWQYGQAIIAQWRLYRQENAIFRRHISPDFPSLEQLASRIDIAFVFGDEFVDPSYPTLSKVIPIGGIGISKTPNKLKQHFLRAIVSAPSGAVLFSLGSIADTRNLDKRKLANLFNAFAHFSDYAFLVKVGVSDEFSREMIGNVPNIHLFEWLPQTDILSHPSLRLFISHCGYNSVLESAIHAVPILGIPLFFDQLRVAKSAEYRGFARILTKSDLSHVERIIEEIGEMLDNPKYKASARRLSKLHREKPNAPDVQLIRWSEFLLANGPLPEYFFDNCCNCFWHCLAMPKSYCVDLDKN
uniref:UDP-glucuronosyltransferase n=1 Tax=Globodera rostochiensis TaxID=31243 RepID=A0A914IG12_GLORO